MSGHGKYRMRTWLRRHLPYLLADRIPKGRQDCGNHEWYRSKEDVWECYHCVLGVWRKEVISETPEDAPSPIGAPDPPVHGIGPRVPA